jgi:hypothetical protein
MIAELRERLRRGAGLSGKPASPATHIRYLASLSHVLSVAVREWEGLDTSPCFRVRRPPEPRGLVRYLDDERRSLLAACQRSSDPRLYLLVVLARAMTEGGCRAAALCGAGSGRAGDGGREARDARCCRGCKPPDQPDPVVVDAASLLVDADRDLCRIATLCKMRRQSLMTPEWTPRGYP